MFKKKIKIQNDQITNQSSNNNEGENKAQSTPLENKHIFKIEEDDEARIYHVGCGGDSDEDEDEEEEDEENEEETEPNSSTSNNTSNNTNNSNTNQKEAIASNNSTDNNPNENNQNIPQIKPEEDELILENFDMQSVAHKIFYKV